MRDWFANRIATVAGWLWTLSMKVRPPYTGEHCPDCSMPEAECYCADEYERDRLLADVAADAGAEAYREGYRDAENEWREPDW